jgi:hypothetical protein
MKRLEGRDLDAAVCELMEPKPTKHPMDYRPWRDYSEGGWWFVDGAYYDPTSVRWYPRPVSASWEWAMRALEQMPQGWHVVRTRDVDLGMCFECCDDYLEAPYGENCIRARAKTGPESICRAIVAAKGGALCQS